MIFWMRSLAMLVLLYHRQCLARTARGEFFAAPPLSIIKRFPKGISTVKLISIFSMSVLLITAQANAGPSPQTLVVRANHADDLIENLAGPGAPRDAAVPRALLKASVCIVSIPRYKRAGFIFGGAYGAGVAACRTQTGEFNAPFFVNLAAGSFGMQFGLKLTDLLLVMTEADARAELTKAQGIKLGVEASLAVGPLGRDLEAGTNIDFHEKTFSYSASRGAFTGLTLNGSKLSYDRKAQNQVGSSDDVLAAMTHFEVMINNLVLGL
jgi:lipid-binding SYLF domain-containing protein